MADPNPKPESILHPGKDVEIPGYGKARVYALGLVHLQKHGQVIGTAVATMLNVAVNPKIDYKMQYMAHMVPFTMMNMLGLVAETTKILEPAGLKIEDLPHWALPPIIEVWLDENFGDEKKWGPWMAVATKAIEATTGKDLKISGILSKLSSLKGTPSETSATAQTNTDSTEGGQSTKSSSGSKESSGKEPQGS